MKKILLILCMSLMLPCYANVEICSNDEQCRDFPEDRVLGFETTTKPTYGINVIMVGGHKNFIEAETRGSALLMLREGYEQLRDYHGWSENYMEQMIRKQDKANIGIY